MSISSENTDPNPKEGIATLEAVIHLAGMSFLSEEERGGDGAVRSGSTRRPAVTAGNPSSGGGAIRVNPNYRGGVIKMFYRLPALIAMTPGALGTAQLLLVDTEVPTLKQPVSAICKTP